MNNAEIIFEQRVFLMQMGELKGIPGTSMTVDGEEMEIPEEIHTYREWQKRGRQVRKGEHAMAKIKIWLPKTKKGGKPQAEDEEADGEECKEFYKGWAHFFTYAQTGDGKEVK